MTKREKNNFLFDLYFAPVVQRIEHQPSKLDM